MTTLSVISPPPMYIRDLLCAVVVGTTTQLRGGLRERGGSVRCPLPRRRGRVVRQRPAKPRTPVRFWSAPLPHTGALTPGAMSEILVVRLDLSFGCRRGSAASSDSVTKAKT